MAFTELAVFPCSCLLHWNASLRPSPSRPPASERREASDRLERSSTAQFGSHPWLLSSRIYSELHLRFDNYSDNLSYQNSFFVMVTFS
jgi:hypothetical protein